MSLSFLFFVLLILFVLSITSTIIFYTEGGDTARKIKNVSIVAFIIIILTLGNFFNSCEKTTMKHDIIKKNSKCYIYFNDGFIDLNDRYKRNFDTEYVDVEYIPKNTSYCYGLIYCWKNELLGVK